MFVGDVVSERHEARASARSLAYPVDGARLSIRRRIRARPAQPRKAEAIQWQSGFHATIAAAVNRRHAAEVKASDQVFARRMRRGVCGETAQPIARSSILLSVDRGRRAPASRLHPRRR
jgi:hypothetical protein